MMVCHIFLAFVVNGEPNRPCWQIPQNNGPEATIQPADALLAPYDAPGADKARVHLLMADMPSL